MINSLDHAIKVQQARFDSGKYGISKAIRRYMQRIFGSKSLDHDDYRKVRNEVIRRADVRWPAR